MVRVASSKQQHQHQQQQHGTYRQTRRTRRQHHQRQPQLQEPKKALASLAVAILLPWVPQGDALADDAAANFATKCAGCHVAGGNIVAAGKGLSAAELERNGYTTADDVASIIALGKGKMPGFGVACTPKGACTFGARLSDEELAELTSFVQERSVSGAWE